MSKLQNNYTTPEQSKQLLELGVPVNSADIVYYNTPDSFYDPYIITEQSQLQRIKEGIGIPCWSVGRLIEIYGFGTNQYIGNIWYRNPMECIISDIEISIENGEMDFSKLDEVWYG